jgi:hypothetical protein
MKSVSDKININQLATLFKLPAFDSYLDNWESETYSYVYNDSLKQGFSESDAEEKAVIAEGKEQSEFFNRWYDAVAAVAEKFFELHGLHLTAFGKGRKQSRPYEYKITPLKSWDDAAFKIVQTINGVGYYHFNNVKEFADSVPCTVRQAVLSHIHWVKDYAEVFGDTSPRRLYDIHMR